MKPYGFRDYYLIDETEQTIPDEFEKIFFENGKLLIQQLDAPARFRFKRHSKLSYDEFDSLIHSFFDFWRQITKVENIQRDTDLDTEEDFIYATIWDPFFFSMQKLTKYQEWYRRNNQEPPSEEVINKAEDFCEFILKYFQKYPIKISYFVEVLKITFILEFEKHTNFTKIIYSKRDLISIINSFYNTNSCSLHTDTHFLYINIERTWDLDF